MVIFIATGVVSVVTINATVFESDPSADPGGVSVDLPDPEDQQPMDQCFDAMQTAYISNLI
jgi:hypothetical protein